MSIYKEERGRLDKMKQINFNGYNITWDKNEYVAKGALGEEWRSKDGENWVKTKCEQVTPLIPPLIPPNTGFHVKKSSLEEYFDYKNKNSVRNYNVGKSDYSKHKIQPWDIWIEYKLNPFDADIVKRILRKKAEPGMSEQESRKMDYQKIIHICEERIRQIEEEIEL